VATAAVFGAAAAKAAALARAAGAAAVWVTVIFEAAACVFAPDAIAGAAPMQIRAVAPIKIILNPVIEISFPRNADQPYPFI
jgi:hypothetical protein